MKVKVKCFQNQIWRNRLLKGVDENARVCFEWFRIGAIGIGITNQFIIKGKNPSYGRCKLKIVEIE